MKIEIDGNDGTGKSTLVQRLLDLGIEAIDRGRMTKATDDISIHPEFGVKYILLDAPTGVSRNRLRSAGKDLNEKYHTDIDLMFYREHFLRVAERFRASIIDSTGSVAATMQSVLAAIVGSPLKIGLPKGRLLQEVESALFPHTVTITGRNLRPRMGPGFSPLLLKPRAIPFMIAQGLLDVAFCGQDLVWESGVADHIKTLLRLGDAHKVQLCAASHDPDILNNPPKNRPLVVATEYPNLTDRWLTDLNLSHVSIQTYGSTECFVPDFADLVIDVVETGQTIQENGLHLIHSFGESETVLVAREGLEDRVDVRGLVSSIKENFS